jgi:hypothetical protein
MPRFSSKENALASFGMFHILYLLANKNNIFSESSGYCLQSVYSSVSNNDVCPMIIVYELIEKGGKAHHAYSCPSVTPPCQRTMSAI